MNIRKEYEHVLSRIAGEGKEERPGLIEAVEEVCRGGSVLLSAPPGYGKTNITYTLAYLASKSLGPWPPRVIHVLPLRSIVEDVYRRIFTDDKPTLEGLDENNVARQMMGYSESPYLQKTLILTTIDTYTFTQLRIPPGDALKIKWGVSLGHGEYSRSALIASTTVFDEVQLFIEENSKLATVMDALLSWLDYTRTPIVVMSATMPRAHEEFICRGRRRFKILRYGVHFRSLDFENSRLSNKISCTCYKVNGINNYVSKIAEIVEGGNFEKILIVVNTVNKAVKIAKNLEEFNPVVVHGKTISKDRASRIRSIIGGKRWILISTQVVEAGVDVSSNSLVTEASPPTSLIQRVGRLLRNVEGEEGLLTLIYDVSEEGTEKAESKRGEARYTVYPLDLVYETYKFVNTHRENIAWHIPLIKDSLGYEEFMEKVYVNVGFKPRIEVDISILLLKLLFKIVDPKYVLKVLEYYGNLVRDSPLVLGVADIDGILDFREGEEYSPRDVAENVVNYGFPLSPRDIKCIIRDKPLVLKFTSTGKLECCRFEKIPTLSLESILRSFRDVLAIVIPLKYYSRKYGFTCE